MEGECSFLKKGEKRTQLNVEARAWEKKKLGIVGSGFTVYELDGMFLGLLELGNYVVSWV